MVYSFTLLELMPNNRYKGQKLTKLVRMNIPATIRSIMASVPEITSVYQRIAIATAISILITLSAVLMFFVISMDFIIKGNSKI
jgi:hypothetical protein